MVSLLPTVEVVHSSKTDDFNLHAQVIFQDIKTNGNITKNSEFRERNCLSCISTSVFARSRFLRALSNLFSSSRQRITSFLFSCTNKIYAKVVFMIAVVANRWKSGLKKIVTQTEPITRLKKGTVA